MTSADARDHKFDDAPQGEGSGDKRDFGQLVFESAIEAEFETGRREETVEEAKHSLFLRILRAVAGFTLIGAGISMLILPGSGWVVIIIGLTLLPFAWAERTVRIIRRKIPGVPEEGRIPNSTWVIMGATMAIGTALSIFFGDDVSNWVRSLGNPDAMFG